MATRRATLKYKDLATFFADREEHLSNGFCFLPPGSVRGDLAAEVKLDLSVPIVGRIGPLTAQVIQRAPDGGYGLKLPDFEAEAGRSLAKLDKSVSAVRKYLKTIESTADPTSEPDAQVPVQDLTAEVARLEARVKELEAALAGDVAPPRLVEEAREAERPETLGTDAPETQGTPEEGAETGGEVASTAAEPINEEAPISSDDVQSPDTSSEPPEVVRGIPIVDVSKTEPNMEGVVEGGGMLTGLLDIASTGMTGLFTLHQEDGLVRYAYFSAGGPVAWRTVPLQEREVLGMLLFKAGQVTKQQLSDSLDIMQSKGVRQGEAFIEMGVMSFSQLIMVLGRQNEYLFQQVMKSTSGTWSFHQLPKLPESFLPPPVRVGALLFRSMIKAAKDFRGRELSDSLKAHVNSYIQLHPSRKKLLPDLGLNATERKLVSLIEERTLRMRELFSMSPLSRQNTAAVCYALIQLGMFTFGARETRDRYLQRVAAGIAKKKRQLIQCSHFDVLECHWISLPAEIDQKYQELKREYDLQSYDELPDDLAKVVRRISKRIDEAYSVLNDDFQRREYRKTLVEDFMIIQSAELLAKKGEMAVMRKDSRMAATCFAKALELQPRSAEYRTALQRARVGG